MTVANEIPTEQDIRAAFEAVQAASERKDLQPREQLRRLQAAIKRFWFTTERFHAQRDAVDLLNCIRTEFFKRPELTPEECPRLFSVLRAGTTRNDFFCFPSVSRIAKAALVLPGAGNHCDAIANALGADVRNVKALWKLLNNKEARRVAA